MTPVSRGARQTVAPRITAGQRGRKSTHDAVAYSREVHLRAPRTSQTDERTHHARTINESDQGLRLACPAEMGEPLLREALRASAITLTLTLGIASCGNVAVAEPPAMVAASKPVMPDLFAKKSEPIMTGKQYTYRGKFYRAFQMDTVDCWLRRETNRHWFSTNRDKQTKELKYAGGFQFSPELASGATWMMQPELIEMFGETIGLRIARTLRAHEMQHWLPYFQLMALFTVVNWGRDGAGTKHFAGGRFSC